MEWLLGLLWIPGVFFWGGLAFLIRTIWPTWLAPLSP
jgi:hypothetical protein